MASQQLYIALTASRERHAPPQTPLLARFVLCRVPVHMYLQTSGMYLNR